MTTPPKLSRLKRGFTFYRLQEENYKSLAGIQETPSKQWIQPRPQDVLDKKYNFNCEVCLTHGNSSDPLLKCIYCNVICHVHCLQKFFKGARYEENWICFYCVDYLDNSRKVFEDDMKSEDNYRRLKNAQIAISKHWRRFAARRHYLRIYLFVVRMQVMFHVRRRKKMFLQTLQGKLRPMKLRIIRCHGIVSATGDRHNHNLNKQTVTEPPSKSHLKPLQSHAHRVNDQSGANSPSRRRDSSFYVLITCMDKNSGGQSLRIPSRLISLDVSSHAPFDLIVEERIMLPGVSGFSTIILSVLQRGVSKDFLLGQCSLNLGNDHIWKRGGHFNLVLQEQEYAIKDHIGMDMKTDSRLIPCGSIEFDLIAFNGMTSECGYCYATNADDFVRTLARLPDYRGFIIPAFGKNALGNALSGNAGSSASNEVSASKAMGSSESYAISMKKIWIVIAEGMLFIYSHFGDQLKVAIEIAAFTHNFEYKDYGKILMYKLHKAGYPDFVFYTASANDSLRWKCAFLCSVRLFGQPATKPLTLSESFDMMPLLQDLWMLESLKPNSYLIKEAQQVVQMQGQVGSSTHHHNSTSSMHSSGGAPAGGGGPSIRSSFGSIAEVAKIFAANGGMRQSHLVKGVAAMGTTRASVLAPVVSPTSAASSSLLKKAQKQLADAGIVDKLPSAPTIVPFAAPSASSKAPSNQQQIFMAIGAQLISERIQEESALDDVVTDEKYQKHGETFVKYLLTAIAEKKQLLKKTKTSSKDLLEEYGLVPNSYR